jgi:hypothetical protein
MGLDASYRIHVTNSQLCAYPVFDYYSRPTDCTSNILFFFAEMADMNLVLEEANWNVSRAEPGYREFFSN